MSAKYVVAIDAGTSGVRCLIADLAGKSLSICRREWGYHSPEDTGPLGKEFDPRAFWRVVCDSIQQALRETGVDARDVVGVSPTSQREGVVFLDEAGEELFAGPNIDLRALTEGISLDSEFGAEIYAITGHRPSFLFVPAKLGWFKTNRPETYRRIATVLTIGDWITYRLCGERVSGACQAGELGLADIRNGTWSGRLRELLGLPDGIYPELAMAGGRVGGVTRRAATETGLVQDTPVVQGAPDTQSGLLGMGVSQRGQVGAILGWSAPVQMVTDEPVFDNRARTWTGCHALPERWVLESSAGDVGNAYHWLKETMFAQEDSGSAYALMDHLALEVPPGAEEVRAFLGPSAMDMSHLAMRCGGFLFPVPLSAGNIQRSHLLRASLENICYAITANCHQLEEISGLKMEQLSIGGGLSQSRCLAQILPNVLGRPVSVSEMTDVSVLGAAICAAVGSGVYLGLKEGIEAMKPGMRVVEPDCLSALEYSEHYQRWVAAGKCLEGAETTE